MSITDKNTLIEDLFQKRRTLNISVANLRIDLAKKEAELLQAEILLNDKWVAKGVLLPLPRV